MEDDNIEDFIVKTTYRKIPILVPLISFLLTLGILIFTIIYYISKSEYEYIENDTTTTNFLNTDTLYIQSGININNITSTSIDAEKIDVSNIKNKNIQSINLNILKTNDQQSNNIKSINVKSFINPNNISFNNRFQTIKTYSPKSYGYICFSFKCDINENCKQVSNGTKNIYIGNKSQLYHFRNKIPPCVLFDSISDQTIDSACTSKCTEKCDIMFNQCDSYISEIDIENIKKINQDFYSDIVIGYLKNSLNVDNTIQSYNPTNQSCLIFSNVLDPVINTDNITDTYCEIIHTIQFSEKLNNIPYVNAYFTSYNGKSSLSNKNTSKEWKDKYGAGGLSKETYCIYKNLDSFLYEDDIFTGDSRINMSINVIQVTQENFKIVISNNYGYKFNNSYSFKYIIY